jgi:hypothetical protein
MKSTILFLLLPIIILGCAESGPPSTVTSSSEFTTLKEKVAFLNQYVAFERNYKQLDFFISYRNNSGGMVPGPSDWDIRVVAQVPPAELENWFSGMKKAEKQEIDWIEGIPTMIDYSGVSDWYFGRGAFVGIDERHSVVLYRNATM